MDFMTHPKHGATYTNAVSEHEANGWTISTTEQWLASKNVEIEEVQNDALDEPKKRGPKPKVK